MKANKKIVVLGGILVVLLAVLAAVWYFTRPATSEGVKNITVEVVHKDGSKKSFSYTTEEEYLDKVLVGEGLVEDNQEEFGLYILVVDGENADKKEAYWNILQNGEATTTGASGVVIHDGDAFSLIYTLI